MIIINVFFMVNLIFQIQLIMNFLSLRYQKDLLS